MGDLLCRIARPRSLLPANRRTLRDALHNGGEDYQGREMMDCMVSYKSRPDPVPSTTVEEVVLGGKVAKVAMDAMVIGWRSLEVGLAGKTVSAATGNISASQITEAGMSATLNATERAALAKLDSLPSTALQGAERESVANGYFMRNGFQSLEGKCGSGNCFDGVFIKGNKVYINETKPLNADGSIKLSGPSGSMETQMTDKWIMSAVKRLSRGSAEQQATAAKIQDAIDKQSLVKIVTGVNSNGMTIVKLK